jgi:hypothetical protein
MAHHQYQSCIDACNQCADASEHCAAACEHEPDPAKMADCIRLDQDCAQICRLVAGYLTRGSEWAGVVSQLCAEVCEACADECGRYPQGHCQDCARACRRCAEECRRVVDVAGRPLQRPGTQSLAH